MVSGFWSSVLCVFCLVLAQAVWADYCTSYWNSDGNFLEAQQCEKYCCGSCRSKVCCSDKKIRLTETDQGQCPTNRPFNIGLIVGITCAVVIPVILGVILVICCVSPHCLIYKHCRKRRNQIARNTVVNTPQSPHSPFGHQPAYGGYQSVPGYEGLPMPSAPPPSYLEIDDSTSFPQGQPLHPLSQPQSPPPHLDELDQPPYNPSFSPQS